MGRFNREGQLPRGTLAWEKVKRDVAKLGGAVEGGLSGRWYTFMLYPPEGMLWNCTGETGGLKVEWRSGDQDSKAEAARDALDRVGMGVSPDDEESD